jgi:hypothetical protein
MYYTLCPSHKLDLIIIFVNTNPKTPSHTNSSSYYFLSLRYKNFLNITAVRSSRRGVVLGCDTVPLSKQLLTCCRTVTPSSSEAYNARCDGLTAAMQSSGMKWNVVAGSAVPEVSKNCRVLHRLGLLDTAHEATMTLVTTGNYSLRNTMSHPGILEPSLTTFL